MDPSKPAPSDAKTDEDKLKDIASEFTKTPPDAIDKPVDTTPSDVSLPGATSAQAGIDGPAVTPIAPTDDSLKTAMNGSDAASTTPSTPALSDTPTSDSSTGMDSGAPTPPIPPAGDTPDDSGAPASTVMGMGAAAVSGGKPKKKGLMMGLIAGAAVLILGGGGAAAYFGYVVPNKPENILKAALSHSYTGDTITSEYFEGAASITDKASDQTFTATFTGKTNDQGAMELSAEADLTVTKLTFDVRSVDGTSIYLKVGGLDGLPELLKASGDASAMAYVPIIKSVNNQWYEITQSLLKQLGYDPTAKLSKEDQQKLGKAYEQHPFLKAQEKLANESIKGMDSYHLRVVIDKSELVAFTQAMSDANISAFKSSKTQLDDLKKALNDVNIDFNKYPVDLWISKDKKMIDQMKFSASGSEVSGSVRLTMYDFNKPVTVDKPTGAKSILEILSEIYGGSSSQEVLQQLETNGISL